MAFGLTDAGFRKKRLDDIKTEIEESLRGSLGQQINTLPNSVLGQIIGIVSEREALLWEAQEDVYNSQYPDTATGTALDNVGALSGVVRLNATESLVTAILFGTPATLVPFDTIFSVIGNPTARFITRSNVTLVAGNNEIQKIAFDAVPDSGDFKITIGTQTTAVIPFGATAATVEAAIEALSNIDDVTVTGSFAADFDIEFVGDDVKLRDIVELVITDNTLLLVATPIVTTVTTPTPGTPQGEVLCDAETEGEVQAPSGSLTEIDTPVFGLDSVINQLDAIVGRELETDLEFRLRRAETLEQAGAATVEAIRSRLLNLTDVVSVVVFENRTMITDIDGRPAKSYEPVVKGGDDDEIAQEIWESKPAGIETFGTTSVDITDSQGFTQTMNFSRPTDVDIWLEMDLTVDGAVYTATDAEIKQAFVDFGATLDIGDDVIVYPKVIAVLDQFDGILDVALRIGIAPAPTLDDNIGIDPNEISAWDTSRISTTIL